MKRKVKKKKKKESGACRDLKKRKKVQTERDRRESEGGLWWLRLR